MSPSAVVMIIVALFVNVVSSSLAPLPSTKWISNSEPEVRLECPQRRDWATVHAPYIASYRLREPNEEDVAKYAWSLKKGEDESRSLSSYVLEVTCANVDVFDNTVTALVRTDEIPTAEALKGMAANGRGRQECLKEHLSTKELFAADAYMQNPREKSYCKKINQISVYKDV